MRRPPAAKAPATEVLRAGRAPLFDLEVSIVTPLFGGSATPAVTDPLQPVRAASVRGHLRFWWRACRGSAYRSADELFQAEERIWGSTTTPSRLLLTIDTLDAGQEVACATYKPKGDGAVESRPTWRPNYPGYALFPFQGKVEWGQQVVPPALAREGVRFRLRIDLAPFSPGEALARDDFEGIEAALWAWLTFGGVGGRTRRGCGSLYCAAPAFAPSRLSGDWLRQLATRHLAASERRLPIPVLNGAWFALGQPSSPMGSWATAVGVMQRFRQVPNGREALKRSRWPEADSVRRATGRGTSGGANNYYPRADLGLPIVFHFIQPRRGSGKPEEPSDATLQGSGEAATRMASPFILKPLALSRDQAVPLVLRLNAPHAWDSDAPPIVLSTGDRGKIPVPPVQLHDAAADARVEPLQAVGGGDIRTALCNYARDILKGPSGRLI